MASLSPRRIAPPDAAQALLRFIGHARRMLDPATPEASRRRLEPDLLALLPALQAAGVFELFELRDAALAALVRDELPPSAPPPHEILLKQF